MDLFQEGGSAIPFVTFFGLVAFVAAILHAAFARKCSFVVGVINVPIPLLIGTAGSSYPAVNSSNAAKIAAASPSR
jgi:hypothetical protein